MRYGKSGIYETLETSDVGCFNVWTSYLLDKPLAVSSGRLLECDTSNMSKWQFHPTIFPKGQSDLLGQTISGLIYEGKLKDT